MDPNQPQQPASLTSQPIEKTQSPGIVSTMGSAAADYGHKHSFEIIRLIQKAIFWLINFIRFVVMQVISQVFSRN